MTSGGVAYDRAKHGLHHVDAASRFFLRIKESAHLPSLMSVLLNSSYCTLVGRVKAVLLTQQGVCLLQGVFTRASNFPRMRFGWVCCGARRLENRCYLQKGS
ncbi:unnamed protein product, partial [Ectocarpus sp. 12 AP-2014]